MGLSDEIMENCKFFIGGNEIVFFDVEEKIESISDSEMILNDFLKKSEILTFSRDQI